MILFICLMNDLFMYNMFIRGLKQLIKNEPKYHIYVI